ncbi:putative chloride transport protein 6 [Apostichopus japonicus]|uniref:Putative chloride transport protein 6 n=1 Tax=Stichopus japonicus TaxID=307972 RepID=A0A2G8KK27_STIJA|nr:putative chloride transport protein 6 [Apostichopus japonicus]
MSRQTETRWQFGTNYDQDVPLLFEDSAPRTTPKDLMTEDYESLDYDICYNEPYKEMVKGSSSWIPKHLEAVKWILMFIIGSTTGLVAVFIDFFVKKLSSLKFTTVDTYITPCGQDYKCLMAPLGILIAFNALFVLIASVLCAFEPIAAGSGIPEIKCYLNGVKVPHVVRLKTLIAKAVGVLFSVSGGLFVGKEGPMIHSGAVVGAGIPQFQSITFKKLNFNFPFFRSDRDKRDFVSAGAAAGVAAAFGAPIGGVLFSLEEGSSFWNQALTWRTFFCAMSATFTLNFMLSGLYFKEWGHLNIPGLIDFGLFQCHGGDCNLWTAMDLLFFIAMGLGGGLLGATFNAINKSITICRLRHPLFQRKYVRVLEAVFIAIVTAAVAFLAAMMLGQCKPLSVDSASTSNISESVRTYFCPPGYYNDMATLFFNPQEEAIKQLFHQEGAFSLSSLAIFFGFFFLLSCWTYGCLVPSGLFVPCLLCGAAYGRFVGNVLTSFFNLSSVYSGTFALIGSAAFLGGVVRMTISLTVILIESTNEISYGLPIMVTLIVAKWSGDFFNKGLYDIHINLKNVPLLEWEADRQMETLQVSEIMERKACYLHLKTRVHTIIDILKTTTHNAFPVVSSYRVLQEEEEGSTSRTGWEDISQHHHLMSVNAVDFPQQTIQQLRRHHSNSNDSIPNGDVPLQSDPSSVVFHGIVMRDHLVELLQNRVCFMEHSSSSTRPVMQFVDLTRDYPRYPSIHDMDLTGINLNMIIDVSRYMNTCPYTVSPTAPVSKVFNLFRTMGLRHLVVVNQIGEVSALLFHFRYPPTPL